MAKRKRKKVVSIYRTVAEVDEALLEMRRAKAERDRLVAEQNRELARIAEKYEGRIEEQTEVLASREAQIKLWADEHRAEMFGNRQSLRLTHGLLSFRVGQLKTESLPKWTLKKALAECERLAKDDRAWKRYLAQKTSLDRQAMLADFQDDKVNNERLAEIGMHVTKDETFAVEPAQEEAQAVPPSAPGERKAG